MYWILLNVAEMIQRVATGHPTDGDKFALICWAIMLGAVIIWLSLKWLGGLIGDFTYKTFFQPDDDKLVIA